MTVDEQLCNTKGRCSFKSYIPTKPGKYGIKIWCLCDATNAYFLNGQIYTGKIGEKTETNQGERVVRELTEKYTGAGRNITCDNFFTSMNLAKYLLQRKTTLVGTVRKTRKFLPASFCGNSRIIGSEFIFHDNNYTIVRYTEKPGKSVTLLSSMHRSKCIMENNKPSIIDFYNETKAGVDTLDQLIRYYTVRRKTRRWPLVLFYNILDIACYNSQVIYTVQFPEFKKKHDNRVRRKFIDELVENIKDSYVEQSELSPSTTEITKYVRHKRVRCQICPREKDSKPSSGCDLCKKATCRSHLWTACDYCISKM